MRKTKKRTGRNRETEARTWGNIKKDQHACTSWVFWPPGACQALSFPSFPHPELLYLWFLNMSFAGAHNFIATNNTLVSFTVTVFDSFFISFLISFFWKMESKMSKETTWKTTWKTLFFKNSCRVCFWCVSVFHSFFIHFLWPGFKLPKGVSALSVLFLLSQYGNCIILFTDHTT